MLAFVMSGDGGWASADRALADALVRHGIPVVGLDSRSYLKQPHTPDQAAADLARTLTHYMASWSRERLVLIGYSRGADILPFLVNRLPPALRGAIAGVALIGLADHASFEFHWADLVRDVRRPTDLPTRPEVDALRGLTVVCSYGEHERGSLCPALDPSLARPLVHGGDHRLPAKDAAMVIDALLSDGR